MDGGKIRVKKSYNNVPTQLMEQKIDNENANHFVTTISSFSTIMDIYKFTQSNEEILQPIY